MHRRPLACAAALGAAHLAAAPVAAQRLQLIEFTADSAAGGYVQSTVILGPTEAVVIDARYYWSDARREADSVAKSGRHLKAVFITHPHEDHYFGAAAFVERFPGTPVLMTPTSIDVFRRTSQRFLDDLRKREPSQVPDSLVTPTALPSPVLTVDGDSIEIVMDQQGDVFRPTNSFIWIPSLKAVITGDIVFNHVHPWLGSSDSTTRARWHASIARIAALHPITIIAGHKEPGAPDTPDQLAAMDRYLSEFDAAIAKNRSAQTLVAHMDAQYPNYVGQGLLSGSAASLLRRPSP